MVLISSKDSQLILKRVLLRNKCNLVCRWDGLPWNTWKNVPALLWGTAENTLLNSTSGIFSIAFLTIHSNVMGQSWTAWNVKNLCKVGHDLLETGLLWTHCPQTTYFMDGQHCGDRGHHLLTPILPRHYNRSCSYLNHTNHHQSAESYWILFLYMFKCVSACLSVCILLKWICAAPVYCSVSLRTSPHSAPKSRGSNSLLWLTQIVNNTINPPFRPLTPYRHCLDYHISTSGTTGHGCATTNHHGGDCDFCGCLSGRNFFVSLIGLLCIL